jgi:hypothetical protein
MTLVDLDILARVLGLAPSALYPAAATDDSVEQQPAAEHRSFDTSSLS